MDLLIKHGRIFREGDFIWGNIHVDQGKIIAVSDRSPSAKKTIDAGGKKIFPGLIDPHVHLSLNLGRHTSRDDFFHGGKAAAFGGVTTIIDFLDPTDHPEDLRTAFHRRLAEAKPCPIDYRFHATVKQPRYNLSAYVKMMLDLGLRSLKLFTTYSESGRRTNDEDIRTLLRLSEKHGFLIEAHIENDAMIDLNPEASFEDLGRARPSDAEKTEALKLAGFVEEEGGYLYMVHLSSGNTLEALKEQYGHLLNHRFFIESCPHYFYLTDEVFSREDGYLYTMAPPVRTADERDKLKSMFDDVHTIGTDHCSFLKKDKRKALLKDIPLGIAGIEQSFLLMYSLYGERVIPKMTENIAKLHGLEGQKGRIEPGYDADFFFYEDDPHILRSHHGATDYNVYEGTPVSGSITDTFSRGHHIVHNGRFTPRTGCYLGRLL
jgi:dihydropyrimidinase